MGRRDSIPGLFELGLENVVPVASIAYSLERNRMFEANSTFMDVPAT